MGNFRYAIFKFNISSVDEGNTDYSKLGYDLADFRDYNRNQLRTYTYKIKEILLNFLSGFEAISRDRQIYFDEYLDFSRLSPNKTLVEESIPFYSAFLILQTNQISYMSNMSDSIFSQKIESMALKYFTGNILAYFPSQFSDFFKDLDNKTQGYLEDYSKLLRYMNYGVDFAVFVCLIFSLFLLSRIRSSFLDVYNSYLNIREDEFEHRVKDINIIESHLRTFQNANYFVDLMGADLREQDEIPEQRGKKKVREYKENCNWFGMAFSLLIILFIFAVQLIVSTIKINLDIQSMDTSIESLNAMTNIYEVVNDEQLSYAALLQYIILGENSQLNRKPILEYMNKRQLDSIERYNKVKSIISLGYTKLDVKPSNNGLNLLDDFPSLCDITPDLYNRMELCTRLDDGIPEKGLIQSNFRVNQMLDEFNSKLIAPGLFKPTEILALEEFINWKYTFTEVYTPANIYWMEIAVNQLEFRTLLLREGYHSVFYEISLCLVLIGSLTILAIYRNIRSRIKDLVYGYRTLGVEIVTENTIVKMQFLSLLRLGQRYF